MTFGPLSEWEDEDERPKRFIEAAPGCPGSEWYGDLASPAEIDRRRAELRSAIAIATEAAKNRFRHLHPDQKAVLPDGYSAPLEIKTTRQMISERRRDLVYAPIDTKAKTE
jgi:hypothetical protein